MFGGRTIVSLTLLKALLGYDRQVGTNDRRSPFATLPYNLARFDDSRRLCGVYTMSSRRSNFAYPTQPNQSKAYALGGVGRTGPPTRHAAEPPASVWRIAANYRTLSPNVRSHNAIDCTNRGSRPDSILESGAQHSVFF